MRYFVLLIFLISTAISPTVYSKIYKWTDEDGKVHMSDKPPKRGGFDEVKVKVNTISSQSPLPDGKSSTSIKKVIMYGAEWCGVCKKAKRYFKSNNIAFTNYDIDKSAKARRDYEKLGGGGIPIIIVGEEQMRGFSTSSFQRLYQNHP